MAVVFMVTPDQRSRLDAIFASPTISREDRHWIALLIMNRTLGPEILTEAEARWPDEFAQSREEWRETGRNVAAFVCAFVLTLIVKAALHL